MIRGPVEVLWKRTWLKPSVTKETNKEANRILYDEYLETVAEFHLEFLVFVCVGSSRRNGANCPCWLARFPLFHQWGPVPRLRNCYRKWKYELYICDSPWIVAFDNVLWFTIEKNFNVSQRIGMSWIHQHSSSTINQEKIINVRNGF